METDSLTTVNELKEKVKKFIHERNWEKYHHPKDIAESICIEAAELLELFQWRSQQEIEGLMKKKRFKERMTEELADILIYVLSMANATETDISESVIKKLEKNMKKYPIEKYYSRAHID
jgi:NTP pyrophosphatase (non-canonical NTP hydrolase)